MKLTLKNTKKIKIQIKRFEKIIKTCSVEEDKIEFLEKSFNDWKNDIPQIDDLLIIGFRI